MKTTYKQYFNSDQNASIMNNMRADFVMRADLILKATKNK